MKTLKGPNPKPNPPPEQPPVQPEATAKKVYRKPALKRMGALKAVAGSGDYDGINF